MLTRSIIRALHFGQAGRSIAANGMTDVNLRPHQGWQTAKVNVAARALSASITRARIWREVLEFVRLPLPLLGVGRGRFFDHNIWPDFRVFRIPRQPFSSPGSVSGLIASTGHSGTQTPQSMHSSGWMTSMFSPSEKQSTGHTSTQSI